MVNCKCGWCKKVFKRYPSDVKRGNKNFCSRKCQSLAGVRLAEKNNSWKGGKRDWWKREVLVRDDWVCQGCGLRDTTYGFMDVNHRISQKLRPDLTHDINNGETLCPNCHRKKTMIQFGWGNGQKGRVYNYKRLIARNKK